MFLEIYEIISISFQMFANFQDVCAVVLLLLRFSVQVRQLSTKHADFAEWHFRQKLFDFSPNSPQLSQFQRFWLAWWNTNAFFRNFLIEFAAHLRSSRPKIDTLYFLQMVIHQQCCERILERADMRIASRTTSRSARWRSKAARFEPKSRSKAEACFPELFDSRFTSESKTRDSSFFGGEDEQSQAAENTKDWI